MQVIRMNSSLTTALMFSCLLVACASPSSQADQTDAAPQAKANEPNDVANPTLRDELLQMREEDQEVRAELKQAMQQGQPDSIPEELVARGRKIDRENTQRLQEIIEDLGRWPGIELVGSEGADAAWLLAQHADQAPEAQDFFLEKLRVAVDNNQVPPKHYAYLIDRTRLKDDKTQLYGTQFDIVNGELKLAPVQEPEKLDERREEMGLEPVEEYLERSREMLLSVEE